MITLDTRSREPIYTQIEKQIVKMINLGVYEVDSPLPSVRSIATDLGINPNTVARAYKSLEQKNIIYTISGKGVFVNSTDLKDINKVATKDFENAVKDAKNSGVDKDVLISIIDKIWGGENI